MDSVVRKLGKSNKSLITVIPKGFASRLNLKPGDEMTVSIEGDSIKLTKLRQNKDVDFESAMKQAEQLYSEFEPLMDYLKDK